MSPLASAPKAEGRPTTSRGLHCKLRTVVANPGELDDTTGSTTGPGEHHGEHREVWYTIFMSTVSYLDRFLEPVTEAFTPELARRLVDLRADDELQAEVEVLRQKANEGKLNSDEEAAYKDFVEAVDVISIIQSKARRFLARYQA